MGPEKKLKIIVTHVPAGSGHEKAAQAIVRAMEDMGLPGTVRILDALHGADSFYRFLFTQGYLTVIQRAPFLWGIPYDLTDTRLLQGFSHGLHRLSNWAHGRQLEKLFLQEKPDAIIGTHFFPMEVAGALKHRGKLSARLITVITDYLPHALWIAQGIDTYVVASQEAKEELIRRGIHAQSIRIFGIPIDPKFGQHPERAALRSKLGILTQCLTILIGSGGSGTGPVRKTIEALGQVKAPLQLVVVAGKNDALLKEMEALRSQCPHPMRVYGFIDNMDELMEVSDLMITKPGGLSCAEALTKGLPLLLTDPIPGQESRNANFLVKQGAALLARSPQEIAAWVRRLLEDPKQFEMLRQKGAQVRFPEAAAHIAEEVLGGG